MRYIRGAALGVSAITVRLGTLVTSAALRMLVLVVDIREVGMDMLEGFVSMLMDMQFALSGSPRQDCSTIESKTSGDLGI